MLKKKNERNLTQKKTSANGYYFVVVGSLFFVVKASKLTGNEQGVLAVSAQFVLWVFSQI